MASGILKLCRAIDYPAMPESDASTFTFKVDGYEITSYIDDGRLILERKLLTADASGELDLARFAGYSVGRMLKEEATLAWNPRQQALILWQAVSEKATDAELRTFFEGFCMSCDWWNARVAESNRPASQIPDMMIRP